MNTFICLRTFFQKMKFIFCMVKTFCQFTAIAGWMSICFLEEKSAANWIAKRCEWGWSDVNTGRSDVNESRNDAKKVQADPHHCTSPLPLLLLLPTFITPVCPIPNPPSSVPLSILFIYYIINVIIRLLLITFNITLIGCIFVGYPSQVWVWVHPRTENG